MKLLLSLGLIGMLGLAGIGLEAASNAAAAPLGVLKRAGGTSPVPYAGKFSSRPIYLPTRYQPKFREMRGIWVATVENIDFARCSSTGEFQARVKAMFDRIRRANFNAVFFQVRPMNDAFYPSQWNPYSRFLSGREGVGLGNFDPLRFLVSEAHKRGLEFHAWLNPYRVNGSAPSAKAAYLKTLAPNNFARRNPGLVLDKTLPNGKHSLFLDPGQPRVVRHILNTVKEILDRYPVDAIHFDDYFYLYTDIGQIDSRTYAQYNPAGLPLAAWRRKNIDTVIQSVKQTITAHNRLRKRHVQFGISPFGIWGNRKSFAAGSLTGGKQSYVTQYADSRKWVKMGWVDYIVPQLYWPFSHEVAAYAALADWWALQVHGTPCRLYIGHGVYRLGAESRWHRNELADQLRYNCKSPDIKGSVFFSYRSVFAPSNATMKQGVEKIRREYWRYPALPPK